MALPLVFRKKRGHRKKQGQGRNGDKEETGTRKKRGQVHRGRNGDTEEETGTGPIVFGTNDAAGN